MNTEGIFIIIAGVASLQLLFIVSLHIVGEIKISRRHIQAVSKNKKRRIRTYKPSLTAMILHNNVNADLMSCLDSIYENNYGIKDVIVIDKTLENSSSNQVHNYRRKYKGRKLHNFSLIDGSNNRSQSTKIKNLIKNKLILMIDSEFYLQEGNIINGLEVFRNKYTLAAIPARQLELNNKMLVALFSLRQFLVRHFMRAFGGNRSHSINKLQRAVLVRSITINRLNTDNILQTNIDELLGAIKQKYNTRSVVYADQFIVKTTNMLNIKASILMSFTAITYIAFMVAIVYQMGLYNSLPVIAVILGIIAIFSILSTNQMGIKLADRFSLIMLSPFTLLSGLVDPLLIYIQHKTITKVG